jgi:hypothetical protein
MARWSGAQIKEEILSDELQYTGVQQDLSLSLLEYIDSHEGEAKNNLKHFFMPPGLFDGIVSILAQELTKKTIRPYICEPTARRALIHQFVSKIRTKLTASNH